MIFFTRLRSENSREFLLLLLDIRNNNPAVNLFIPTYFYQKSPSVSIDIVRKNVFSDYNVALVE